MSKINQLMFLKILYLCNRFNLSVTITNYKTKKSQQYEPNQFFLTKTMQSSIKAAGQRILSIGISANKTCV
jgi:hypothetical protein